MSSPSTAAKLHPVPRRMAKHLPRQKHVARVRIVTDLGVITIIAGEVVRLSGFAGLVAGDYVVTHTNPSFNAGNPGGAAGLTIRLRPVTAPKAKPASKSASKVRRLPKAARR